MLNKAKLALCTSLSAVFALVAAGGFTVACPIMFYQPELPKKN